MCYNKHDYYFGHCIECWILTNTTFRKLDVCVIWQKNVHLVDLSKTVTCCAPSGIKVPTQLASVWGPECVITYKGSYSRVLSKTLTGCASSGIQVPIQLGSFYGADMLVSTLGARHRFAEKYNYYFLHLSLRNKLKWVNVDRTAQSRLCIMWGCHMLLATTSVFEFSVNKATPHCITRSMCVHMPCIQRSNVLVKLYVIIVCRLCDQCIRLSETQAYFVQDTQNKS